MNVTAHEEDPAILALDLATTTGWALRDRCGIFTSGTQSFKLGRGESEGMRAILARKWLRTLLLEEPAFKLVDLVVYEKPMRFLSGSAIDVAYGLKTVVTEECERIGITYSPLNPSTLKKWATGKGNAKKDVMVAEAKRRFPREVIVDDNQADALLGLAWAVENYADALKTTG